jgi:peptide deformylase
LTIFVNPRITFLTEETESMYEGCLSVPNLRGRVDRRMHIRVDAWDREGNSISFEVRGLTAGTYQHEFDHLQGMLFVDRVSDASTLSTWSNFEAFHRDEFVAQAEALVTRYGS